MNALVFPGQGAQHQGMGKELYNTNAQARELFEQANHILGFRISDIMFEGSDDDLRQTKVTQPAIFLDSVIKAIVSESLPRPDMVAGHSLGEFSALVVNKSLDFHDGLKLVYARALAMQKACDARPGTMAAILGLDDSTVESVCQRIDGIVVAANFNCPGQVVISGSIDAVESACESLKAAGAKRALLLQVGGAFHSPLMEPARTELEKAISETEFKTPICPVYQNVSAQPSIDSSVIKQRLIEQLTGPVKWTQSVQQMVSDGATKFIEVGPGKVLQGLIKKIASDSLVEGI